MFQVLFIFPDQTSYGAKVFTIPRKGEQVYFGGNIGWGTVVNVNHSIDISTAGEFHRVTIYLDKV